MKTSLFIMWFLSFPFIQEPKDSLTAQKLVGIWQADTWGIASGWSDCYQFYSEGQFIFNFNQMFNYSSRRILAVLGNYTVTNSGLILTVTSTKELVGGQIVRGRQEGEWEIEGGKLTRVPQKKSQPDTLSLSLCTGDNSSFPCIQIDNRKFYKLKEDPNDFR